MSSVFSFLWVITLSYVSCTVTKTLSGVPYSLGSSSSSPRLSRIEFVTVTVDDMILATEFYQNVLGGYLINFCDQNNDVSNGYCTDKGYVRYSGDVHHLALFGIDEQDGVQVPNIRTSGEYEVQSQFLILGNSLIQLMQFVRKSSGDIYNLRNNLTSPCWMANAHIDFWIENSIDANDYIYDVESRSHALGGHGADVKFNRPVPQQTRQDRDSVPKSKYANKVTGGSFDGLAWAYFKGPVSEQLEIYQIDRTIQKAIGAAYCNRGAVSTAFISSSLINSNTSKYGWGEKIYQDPNHHFSVKSSKNSTSQRLHGLFQYGYRTNNLHRATGFYTEVLGGNLISYPTQGIEIMRDDSAHWMILANETIESYEYADENAISKEDAMRLFGVANISSTGYYRLDHRFILFDNYVVEPLQYTEGLTFGGKVFDPQPSQTSSTPPRSSAYIGTIMASFGLDLNHTNLPVPLSITSLSDYLLNLEQRLLSQGYSEVRLPITVGSFPLDHPFSGLEYGTMKGPDGEVIQIVTINSMKIPESNQRFKNKLHEALLQSGGVSTLFDDTNPYLQGEMDEFCAYALYEDNYATLEGFTTSDQCIVSTTNHDTDENDFTTSQVIIITLCCVTVLLVIMGYYGFMVLKKEIQNISINNKVTIHSSTDINRSPSQSQSPNPILGKGNFDI